MEEEIEKPIEHGTLHLDSFMGRGSKKREKLIKHEGRRTKLRRNLQLIKPSRTDSDECSPWSS
jgi:hypothetical protein